MRVLIVSSQTGTPNALLNLDLVNVGYEVTTISVISDNYSDDISAADMHNASDIHEPLMYADDISCACKLNKKLQVLFDLRPNASGVYNVTLLQAYYLVVVGGAGVMAMADATDAPALAQVFAGSGRAPQIWGDIPDVLLKPSHLLDVPVAARLPSPPELHARSFA